MGDPAANDDRRSRGDFPFEDVLPRLVALYEAGRLVPFIGAGMSRPGCVGWPELITGLEDVLGVPRVKKDAAAKPKAEELIRRANDATRRLRAGRPGQFEEALEAALFDERLKRQVPEQTAALAAIWWPLVLTTNYDNFYVEGFSRVFGEGGLRVVGRGPEDCQRVLTSLSTAGRAVFWALQGHLGRPFPAREDHQQDTRLAREIVLDHAEYRRVAHREPHFRRAFAEVFRQRSLLFLGAGLAEPYFQELFGEVLEFYGPGTRTHYALIPRGEVDPRFMYSRFQIATVEFSPDDYTEVPRRLRMLAAALDRRASVPTAWSWGRSPILHDGGHRSSVLDSTPALEVITGALPTEKVERECLAVSAGGRLSDPTFFLSPQIYRTVGAWGVPIDETMIGDRRAGIGTAPALRDARFVGEYAGHDVFAVRARNASDDKDLSQIEPASLALFDIAAPAYRRIHMQLLASGGTGHDRTTWSRRPFPARFTFIEIVRAWGNWKRRHPENTCCLTLHLVAPEICREIASGRIDIGELLLAEDLRFWAEIVESDGSLERRLFHKLAATPLGEILDELGLSDAYWTLDVSPPASIDDAQPADAPVAGQRRKTLRDLRVVPGGTLHFHRVSA